MLFRMETGLKGALNDAPAMRVLERIRKFLHLHIAKCRIVKVFTVSGLELEQLETLIREGIWFDPILQEASIGPLPLQEPLPDWFCEISYRPGVTDNEARTAAEAASLVLDIPKNSFTVGSSTQYRFVAEDGYPLYREDIEKISRDLLCNELIQRSRIKNLDEWREDGGFAPLSAKVAGKARDDVASIDLSSMDDAALENLSRSNTWALSLAEMLAIKAHFADPLRRKRRKEHGLPENPTDVEMETLAQTWSEHCKHKIFSSHINYYDAMTGRRRHIDNLYKSCIRDATELLRRRAGKDDYCLSVFKDNAGVIAFGDGYDACIKVETHNSPSALDPYGGALTGIVGVNRDPLGTGMGADLICNMDVFCFASPFYDGKLPSRLLHPRRIFEGVRKGIEDGGNKSGIPTVNGSIVFDERYLGKPLVFCGTVGLIPETVCGHPGYEKAARNGDAIVMAGGRIGKDGIHGATFSSEELHEGSPATAVQIGDPITQRKMYDFILRARDACLYHSITDNGAGGLSSSVGEMAEDTGGCILKLDKAPLKYDGLVPWEILLSEAQERMTFAVPQEKLDEFLTLASHMDVEATALGYFTDSGFFEVYFKDKPVARLEMDFLHNGAPKMHLDAVWKKPEEPWLTLEGMPTDCAWNNDFLLKMLSRLNICSRESVIRQYDHEVRGGSVIKPLNGIERDGPGDAAVLRPLLESDAGLVLAHGICPKYSDYDTYWMAANAIDEAIRNAVAVGGNPDFLAGVDNFCWCDPIKNLHNPDGEYKLAQLVRACEALRHFCLAYGTPCISGKDSMKNDYVQGDSRISIPPTLLFTVLGVIDNVTQAQTSDFKKPGDVIYILGGTWREMGASEACEELGRKGGRIPRVESSTALARYRALHGLMSLKVPSACHDCSDGGLAVALAEMCIGGRLGCEINLDNVPAYGGLNAFETMYSESASRHIVTVREDLASLFDALGMWQICRSIGKVTADGHLKIKSGDSLLVNVPVEDLAKSFSATLSF